MRRVSNSRDLEQRIEEAAARRAKIKQERAARGEGGRPMSGFERKLELARAERLRALSQTPDSAEEDEAPFDHATASVGPNREAQPDEVRDRMRAFTRSLTLTELQPREATVTTHAPRAGLSSIRNFSTGLAAGVTICAAVIAVSTYGVRQQSWPFMRHGMAPDVTTSLTEVGMPERFPAMASPVSTGDRSGEIVARSAITPLSSPLPLAHDPRPSAFSPEPPPSVSVSRMPPLQEERLSSPGSASVSEQAPRRAWDRPPPAAANRDLAPVTADGRPAIHISDATPDFGPVEIALAEPSIDPDAPPLTGGRDDGVERSIFAGMVKSALPSMPAGAAGHPAVYRPEGQPGSAPDRGAAPMHPASLTRVAPLEPRQFDASRPTRHARGAQPALTSESEELPNGPVSTGSLRPDLDTMLATASLTAPVSDVASIELPHRDVPPGRPAQMSTLAALAGDAPFSPSVTGRSLPSRDGTRAIVTVSPQGAEDTRRLDRLGLDIARVQVTPFSIPRTRVHYFHSEDAAEARSLAARLEGEVVDMTGIVPSPPRGLLEIQLSD